MFQNFEMPKSVQSEKVLYCQKLVIPFRDCLVKLIVNMTRDVSFVSLYILYVCFLVNYNVVCDLNVMLVYNVCLVVVIILSCKLVGFCLLLLLLLAIAKYNQSRLFIVQVYRRCTGV